MHWEGICQGSAEGVPGGGGNKVSLDSFKRASNHENRTYCLSRRQSANQVHQLCTKLNRINISDLFLFSPKVIKDLFADSLT